MIDLDYRSGYYYLIDNIDPSPIISGRHRIFFAYQLNGVITTDGNGWQIPAGDNIYSTFLEITTYLHNQRFDYQLLDGAREIREKINTQQDLFQTARNKALRIKESGEQQEINPPNFVRRLRNHQMLATQHLLAAIHGANFSVPGSGKTSVVYAAYSILRDTDTLDGLLVIGPPSSFMAWENEYIQCFGRSPNIVRLAGITREQRETIYQDQEEYEIFLTTYHTAYRDVEDCINLARQRDLLIVLDESHYVKRIAGGRIAEAVLRISPNAQRRVILTGTPMPNDVRDLWTQMTFLWPNEEIFGDRQRFILRESDLESVREEIRPFYIRIRKRDLELPNPKFHLISVPMAPHQRVIYRALAIRTLAELDLAPTERSELRRWRRAKLIRLLQASSNPSLLTRYSDEFRFPPIEATNSTLIDLIERYPLYEIPTKIQHVIDLTREIVNSGRKVLIWTWFVHNITMLSNSLSDLSPLAIHGTVPIGENVNEEYNRESIIRTFLESADHNVLIANPAACAESISLHTACHDAIYLDRTFNCGQYLQSLDRIHRIGLNPDDEINYYILVLAESIDETVRERLAEKEERMLAVIDEDLPVLAMDAISEDVSDEEIDVDFARVITALRRFTEDDDPSLSS